MVDKISKEMSDYWENRWQKGETQWDRPTAHLSLIKLLERCGKDGFPVIPTSGKALIPGCGRGYDVLLFAQHGLDALGLEISPTAVEAANKWIRGQDPGPAVQKRVNIAIDDFYTYEPKTRYDVLCDYTFLSTVPPHRRPVWAETFTRLAAPGAIFITLQWPFYASHLEDTMHDWGPPYALSRQVYDDALGADWERVWEYQVPEGESREVGVKGEEVMEGFERLVVWRKRP